jgi:cyanophycinase
VSALLRDATAVWISGGDQCRLTSIYGGTAVERELARLIRRGGVVGGTSAGASAVCVVMMAGAGKTARGLGLIVNAIIDQHFTNRSRLGRLLDVLHRHPGQTGIGIDEETAVVLRGADATVLGNGTVTVATSDSIRVYRAGSHFRNPSR